MTSRSCAALRWASANTTSEGWIFIGSCSTRSMAKPTAVRSGIGRGTTSSRRRRAVPVASSAAPGTMRLHVGARFGTCFACPPRKKTTFGQQN
eukprot:5182504-Prymnesium_polylepis.1